MAAREIVRKLLWQVLIQKLSILALVFQLHGLVITYKILQMKRDLMVSAYFATWKSKMQRKRKHIQARRILRKARTVWVVKGRTEEWWLNMLGEDVPEFCWRKNFRLSRQSFFALADELRPFIAPKNGSPNYRFLTTEKKLAITLYYLKDTGSLLMTGNTFGIHQCTVSKTISDVCEAVSKELGPKYLHLPRNKQEMRHKVSEFELKFGMTQAFGCIDGTHVPIKRPIANSRGGAGGYSRYSLNTYFFPEFSHFSTRKTKTQKH